MSPRRAVVAGLAVASVAAAGALSATSSAPVDAARPRVADRDAATLAATATAFLDAVADVDPAHPAGGRSRWVRLVTRSLGRELAADPPTAAGGGTQHVTVTSVAVRAGSPPTALVLGVLTGTDGEPAPIAWTVTFARTPLGWRVAAVTS